MGWCIESRAGFVSRVYGDASSREADLLERLERLEAVVLQEALQDTEGNQTEAARELDMPRRTLVHKIKVLGLKRDS